MNKFFVCRTFLNFRCREKDDEIRNLTARMEAMAFEFANMLKETLDKMSQRIEVKFKSNFKNFIIFTNKVILI